MDSPTIVRTAALVAVLLAFGAAVLAFGACSSDPGEPAVVASASAVIGGTPAGACAWPSTVRVDGASSCTGTLIHPRVVTTAAHCLDGTGSTAMIGFGPRNAPGSFSLKATCNAGVRGESGVNTANDWGYCVLPEDARVLQVETTPPLVGCEAERFLKAGAHAWVVGYGDTRVFGEVAGAKNQVEVVINQLDKLASGTIDVGDAQVGACHGDSGGPIYMKLADADHDWGFRVFGSTSGPGSRFCDCNCSTTYVNIANHVRAIEQNEDIDVTPCTDADGNWDPGPACAGLPADPTNGSGTFPSCSLAITHDPIETCGKNPGVVPDAGIDPAPDAATSMAGSGASAGSGGTAGSGGAAAGSGGSAGSAVGGAGGTGGSAAGAAGGATATGSAAGGSGGAGGVAPAGAAGAIPPPPIVTPPPAAIGGSGGLGGVGGALATSGAGAFAPPPYMASNAADSGCSCSVPGASPRSSRTPLVLAACVALIGALRRRRRARSRVDGVAITAEQRNARVNVSCARADG